MKNRLSLLLGALVIAFAGCMTNGLDRAAVEGTVTVDETPLEKGAVHWYPVSGQGPTVGADIKDGRYKLDRKNGPVVGEYRIEVRGWPVKTGKKIPSQQFPGTMEDELVDSVPDKYRTTGMGVPAKEELKATVRSGKNTIDFTLTSN